MSDTIIVLEDENGDKHDANYLATKQGLSAGWRGFAMKHYLQVGDAVVFELVALGSKTEQPKFKASISHFLQKHLLKRLFLSKFFNPSYLILHVLHSGVHSKGK
jgi:hypothetical protein